MIKSGEAVASTPGGLETPVSLYPLVLRKDGSKATLARGILAFVTFGSLLAGAAGAPPPSIVGGGVL